MKFVLTHNEKSKIKHTFQHHVEVKKKSHTQKNNNMLWNEIVHRIIKQWNESSVHNCL